MALLCLLPAPAQATEGETIAPGETISPTESDAWVLIEGQLDLSQMEDTLSSLDALLGYGDELSLSSLWQSLRAGELPDFKQFLTVLGQEAGGQLRRSTGLLAQLLLLSLLMVLLSLVQDSFGGSVSTLSRWVVYLALLALAVLAFDTALTGAGQAVNALCQLLLALLPPLLILLAAAGAAGAAALLSPALLAAVEVMGQLMGRLIFPLIYLSAVLRLVEQLTPRFRVSRLADLFRDFSLGLMGVLTTVFVALLGFLGVTTASGGGLTVKMAKSAASAFIPVVGRTLADVLDSVLAAAALLKNTLGVLGAVAAVLICASPAIGLLLQSLIFRLAGALVQPLGDEQLSTALYTMGKSLTLLFAALAICGLFAFFAIGLLVGLGNLAMSMR